MASKYNMYNVYELSSRRVLHFQLVRYLVAVGEVAAKNRSEMAERFKLPNISATNRVFLTSVKVLIAVAETQQELLVANGMSLTLLEELSSMVAELGATSSAPWRRERGRGPGVSESEPPVSLFPGGVTGLRPPSVAGTGTSGSQQRPVQFLPPFPNPPPRPRWNCDTSAVARV